MIDAIENLPLGTIGFRFTGHVSGDDYDGVLTPAIDEAIATFDRIKFLAQFGPQFEGYSLEAAWDDTKLGLRQWSGFERVAVVTDVTWIRTAVQAMGVMMPCPIRVFSLEELEDAQRWLIESLGAIHLDGNEDYIAVRLIGKLEPSAYDGVDDDLSNLMSRSDHIRLVLDLREFDGWSGISALGDHLSLIREHRRAPERVAVIGDKAWQRLAQKVVSKFINAETQFFEAAQYDEALTWVTS